MEKSTEQQKDPKLKKHPEKSKKQSYLILRKTLEKRSSQEVWLWNKLFRWSRNGNYKTHKNQKIKLKNSETSNIYYNNNDNKIDNVDIIDTSTEFKNEY